MGEDRGTYRDACGFVCVHELGGVMRTILHINTAFILTMRTIFHINIAFILTLFFVPMPNASADILCLKSATGSFLEQCGACDSGYCNKRFVTDNPQFGYSESDITEIVMTSTEWNQYYNQKIMEPIRQNKEAKNNKLKEKKNALKGKLNLTDADFDDLIEIVKEIR